MLTAKSMLSKRPVLKITEASKKKSTSFDTRGITPRRVSSGDAHLRGLAHRHLGNLASKKHRSVGEPRN